MTRAMEQAVNHKAGFTDLLLNIDELRTQIESMCLTSFDRSRLLEQLGALRRSGQAMSVAPIVSEPILDGYRQEIHRSVGNLAASAVVLSYPEGGEASDCDLQQFAMSCDDTSRRIYRYLNLKVQLEENNCG